MNGVGGAIGEGVSTFGTAEGAGAGTGAAGTRVGVGFSLFPVVKSSFSPYPASEDPAAIASKVLKMLSSAEDSLDTIGANFNDDTVLPDVGIATERLFIFARRRFSSLS